MVNTFTKSFSWKGNVIVVGEFELIDYDLTATTALSLKQ